MPVAPGIRELPVLACASDQSLAGLLGVLTFLLQRSHSFHLTTPNALAISENQETVSAQG